MDNLNNLLLLDPVLEQYKEVPGSLITVLQKTQDIFGYLPESAIAYISEKMNVPTSKIYGVATFYTQFRFNPVGRYFIQLCQGTACHVNGSQLIEKAIKDELGISDGETSDDGLFTLKNVACLGCCSLSPVMTINGETFGSLTPSKVRGILNELKSSAESEAE
ncbi:MAG: NADH-quinone oxidoreductase subunit NuoE [Clostridia bacterium]|nr:NADH-quinone oxidoreductase subunit NuoE [Clostridia bacterium]